MAQKDFGFKNQYPIYLSYFQSIIRTLKVKRLPENNQEIVSENKPQQTADKTATKIKNLFSIHNFRTLK